MNDNAVITSDLASVLTDEERSLIDVELTHVPHKKGAAIDALKIVQESRGWVSDDCLYAIACFCDNTKLLVPREQ